MSLIVKRFFNSPAGSVGKFDRASGAKKLAAKPFEHQLLENNAANDSMGLTNLWH